MAQVTTTALEHELDDLLRRFPSATLGVLNRGGVPTQLPPSIREQLRHGDRPVVGNPIEVLVRDDRLAAVTAWGRARVRGRACVRARALAKPDEYGVVYIANLTEHHGVFVSLFLPDGTLSPDADEPADEPPPSALAPARVGVVRFTPQGKLIDADDAATSILGWTRADLLERRAFDLIHPDDGRSTLDSWLAMLAARGTPIRERVRYARADGGWRWIEATYRSRLDEPEADILGELADVDAEMRAPQGLATRIEDLRRLTRALPVGVLQVDSSKSVVFTNPRFRELVGVGPFRTVADVAGALTEADRPGFTEVVEDVIAGGDQRDLEVELVPSGDQRRVCQLDVRPLATTGAAGADVIVCVTDVTASRVVRDELSQRATFDDLTGCHNRASTVRELTRLTAAGPVGVVYIDLDGFKPVNDRYGHAAGDEVLALVAARLRAHVRQHDVVGRVGGDEFVVLYPGIDDADTLARLTARLQGALEEPVSIAAAGTLDTTASIGSVIADRGDQPEAILAAADAAMYLAKRTRQRR